jgi:glycolate oxidase FAD binding subunit
MCWMCETPSGFGVDFMPSAAEIPEDWLFPWDEAELEGMIQEAAGQGTPIEIRAGGTLAGFGRPNQAEKTLTTVGLQGITLYEPTELVLSAKAGTTLMEIDAALQGAGQRLPFDPVDFRTLLGNQGDPTIGGLVATNLTGSSRVHSGAVRDALIGVRMVTGRGETIHSGGRVMKNVTGYDLVKLACGAHGTLGVLTEVTFKTLPDAQDERTLLYAGLDDARAVAAMTAALGSPYEVSGAAHLPNFTVGPGRTLIRLQGFRKAVTHRVEALTRDLAEFGTPEILPAAESIGWWSAIRDVIPLCEPRARAVWRISVKPTDGPKVTEALREVGRAWFYDWGGGLVWLATEPERDAGAAAIRAVVKRLGGHATLVRAAEDVRGAVDVFEPQPEPLMAVTRRLKEAFDPKGILNPGRMYAGV